MISFRGLKAPVPTLVEGRARRALGTVRPVSISRLAARKSESGTLPSWKVMSRPWRPTFACILGMCGQSPY